MSLVIPDVTFPRPPYPSTFSKNVCFIFDLVVKRDVVISIWSPLQCQLLACALPRAGHIFVLVRIEVVAH